MADEIPNEVPLCTASGKRRALIILTGPPGSYKSYFAYNLDKDGFFVIKDPMEAKRSFASTLKATEYIVATRNTHVVVDGWNHKRAQRDALIQIGVRYKLQVVLVYFNFSAAICKETLRQRASFKGTPKRDVFPTMEKYRNTAEFINAEEVRALHSNKGAQYICIQCDEDICVQLSRFNDNV